jgi:hypothetical protein
MSDNSKTMPRAKFDALSHDERQKFISGGRVVTDPPPPPAPQVTDTAVLTRAEFAALSPAGRLAAVKASRKVVDGQRAAPPAET